MFETAVGGSLTRSLRSLVWPIRELHKELPTVTEQLLDWVNVIFKYAGETAFVLRFQVVYLGSL